MTCTAIIVLGNLMDKNGILNTESSLRMNYAIECFQKNENTFLITCGWAYRDDSPVTIADAMKIYAVKEKNISPRLIITERNSRDTVGDAIFVKKNIIPKKNWIKIIVITSDYHASRTDEIFTYVFGKNYNVEVKSVRTKSNDKYVKNEKKSLDAFHKTFSGVKPGDIYSIYQCLCSKHPFYNGDIYPII